ncbi:NADH-quinone oxidoreductase subunit D [bacterium]|jgi:NADH-quinone oxidoreductase subunit D|nr:NADH-quinone oxidoreductase subunit D [bacterium]
MPLDLTEPADPSSTQREGLWTLNFGPQHPATHTTLRLILTLDGEQVVDVEPDIGFLHSGFEKLGEVLDFNQYVTIVDRMNYISPMANEIAWHHAVEEMLGIELTPRTKCIRTIFAELMRIHDHLLCLGTCVLDLGGATAFFYAFNEREKIYDICERASGQRFHTSYTRVGGLLYDVTDDWVRMVQEFLRTFPKAYADVQKLVMKNRIFIERTRDVGYLSKEAAINGGATGPVARASGVERDLRRDEPYLLYDDLDFDVICSTAGDCYARFHVRVLEIAESLKIITQAIARLPSGPVYAEGTGKEAMPDKREVYQSIEGLIHHFESIMPNRQPAGPKEELYSATESPNGELGYYLVSDGSYRAYRARTRPPSLIHFSLFPSMMRGYMLSDVVAVLGSLNIIAAELDR